jgi:hypothetical protein
MAKKSSPSKSKKKGASKSGAPATVCQDVAIEVCCDQRRASVGSYIIWTNRRTSPCHVDFNDPNDGCPLDQCSFVVPAASALGPGTWPTKVVGTGGGKSYHYNSKCCPRPGIPIVIID